MGSEMCIRDSRIAVENVARIADIDEDSIRSVIFDSGLQSEYETGQINSSEFVQRFNASAGCQLDETGLLNAVSDIFTLNRTMVPLLTQLSASRFPIGILSNTCEAHWNFILNRSPLLKQIFPAERCVLSFEVSSMKPDLPIYAHAQKVAGVAAEKIFFCDDLQRNVDGAIAVSFKSLRFESSIQLLRRLNELNVVLNL